MAMADASSDVSSIGAEATFNEQWPPPVVPPPPELNGDPRTAALVAALAFAPLVFRRRFPLTVLWLVMGAILLSPGDAPRATFYACLIAAFTAVFYSPFVVATLVTVVLAAGLVGELRASSLPIVSYKYIPFLILIPVVAAAYGIRRWKGRTEALQRDQAEALRRATEQERGRIARELHDVVTHNVSVMVIQAGAARKVLDTSPEQTREALLAVEAGGRAAMAELRHVMGLLAVSGDGDDLAPQPGLERLEALIARMRNTGVPVELTTTGHPRPIPSGIDLAAYRVVQEALTNTVKHAAGASATVTVDYGEEGLRVEVTDTGGAPDPSAAAGNGRGLIGLRERLDLYGGTLLAGPRPTGGFRVRALIPLELL
jgi:signal transduction histidine kinase